MADSMRRAAPQAVPTATGAFAIAYGDTVSDGVPGPGAGNIETGGDEDAYTFAAAAGDVAIFDVLTGSAGAFRWRVAAPDGTALFDGLFTDRSVELAHTGSHTITVRGARPTTTGRYSFRLALTPPPQHFAIALGDTVVEDVPAVGAGNLEAPGAQDVYTFTATAGQTAILDLLAGNNVRLGWRLDAPDGTTLFDHFVGDRQVALPVSGSYTLTVRGNGVGDSGTYSFRLLEAPVTADEFTIAFGQTVSDGVPGPGAGNLEAPGAVDRYRFAATAGQRAELVAVAGRTTAVRWSLEAPDGTVVFDDFFVDQDERLPQTGTYTLAVRGVQITSVGTYAFELRERPPNAPPTVVALADRESTEGDNVLLVVEGDDPDGDVLAFSAEGLPPDLAIAPATGEITGTIAAGASDGGPYLAEITVSDPEGASASTRFRWSVVPRDPEPGPIDVDVLPRRIVNDGHGVIPLVIFGSDRVPVRQIDARTIELEGMPIATLLTIPLALRWHVNRDGRQDLIVLIRDIADGLPTGDSTVTATARTVDGMPLAGSDDVEVLRHRP